MKKATVWHDQIFNRFRSTLRREKIHRY